MGEYYHFVNHTKRQQFFTGALGGAFTFSGIGFSLTARAFCLLLTRGHDRPAQYHALGVGTWIGDRVECIGDHGTLQDEYTGYHVITANIIVMLYQVDGPDELVDVARSDNDVLMQLAHLAVTGQFPALDEVLENAFGTDWRQQYDKNHKFLAYQLYDLVPHWLDT